MRETKDHGRAHTKKQIGSINSSPVTCPHTRRPTLN
jgi:hypothetical protein